MRLDLLEELGKEYLIDHVKVAVKDQMVQKAYGMYVSETLRGTFNYIAHFMGGQGIDKSFNEILHQKPETRSAVEIKATMLDKLHAMK